jgi:hypothetical protein
MARSGHVAATNGCGTEFLALQGHGEEYGLTACCNAHDTCYGSCGGSFVECEERFTACLKSACESNFPADSSRREECQSTAALFSTGTRMMGCQLFLDGQKHACDCSAAGGPGGTEPRTRQRRPRAKGQGRGGSPLSPRGHDEL